MTQQSDIPSTSDLENKKPKRPKKPVPVSRLNSTNNTSSGKVLRGNNQLDDKSEEIELKYGAAHVIHLFVPVSLCMAVVIGTMSTIGYYSKDDGVYLIYTPFTKKTSDVGELFVMSIGNALIMLFCVVVMTTILILLYKFRFYKIIHGWLILSSLILLSFFTVMYLQEVFKNYNIPLDYVTLSFFIWNYGCLGMICIHWKGPLLLQQFYLIIISALMALVFIKFMPEWTVWTVLAVLSIWDLVAVLCPSGPLRILVETAQERNEPIFPALIYSSGVMYLFTVLTESEKSVKLLAGGDQEEENNESSYRTGLARSATENPLSGLAGPSGSHLVTAETTSTSVRYAPIRKNVSGGSPNALTFNKSSRQRNNYVQHQQTKSHRRARSTNEVLSNDQIEVEEQGVKLGLGDFIFYSVLVGKASSFGDWNTTAACYVAILVGLAFTLMLLALFRKALPALPISIFAGISFYFATREIMTPFTSELSLRSILL